MEIEICNAVYNEFQSLCRRQFGFGFRVFSTLIFAEFIAEFSVFCGIAQGQK